MRLRAMFVAGVAVGYVLGTHAGRDRYEQLRRLSRRLTESPTVQEAAGVLRARADRPKAQSKTKSL
jgi:hypothetical protein